MELLGGLLLQGSLRRDFSFKPITGALERILSESGFRSNSLAEQVTFILAHALESLAGSSVNEEIIRSLNSGDRLYLIQQLEAIIDPSPKWLTSPCDECDELIQFQLVPGTLPVKPAGKNFPETLLSLSIGDVEIRVPTGKDQEIIARGAEDETSAMNLLLQRLLTIQNHRLDINTLTVEDRELIDLTLDEITPQASEAASVECPYCDHPQLIPIDSYKWISNESHRLDHEIHTLAFIYHWSEKDILDLPRVRRQRYLQIIERSLGKYKAEDFMQSINKDVG